MTQCKPYELLPPHFDLLCESLVGYVPNLFCDKDFEDSHFSYNDDFSNLDTCKIRKNLNNDSPFISATPLSLIANGDCLTKMSSIPDNSVDLILTDPPYNLGLFMKKRGTNLRKLRKNHFSDKGWDDLEYEEWMRQMDIFLSECHRVLKKKGNLLIFMSVIKAETIISLATKNGFYYKTVGTWHKTNPMPRNMNLHFINSTESWLYFVNDATTGVFNNNGKPIHDFIETATISASEHKKGNHPTQKPISVMKHFVDILSNDDGVVLDPFMGSGSTGVACENSHRLFLGIELNEEYFNNTKLRLQHKL